MNEQIEETVERLYELAKSGDWGKVLLAFNGERRVAGRCSRFRKRSSGWTFLHQAAYFGHVGAVRALIRLGASLTARSEQSATPADVADERGHTELASLIRTAAYSAEGLWEPSSDPEILPTSSAWTEAVEKRASHEMRVAYGRGIVVIQPGSKYFVDSLERVLVGWHGTYDPPRGMNAEPLF